MLNGEWYRMRCRSRVCIQIVIYLDGAHTLRLFEQIAVHNTIHMEIMR